MHAGVVVGVHAHAEPARLVETVRWLQFGRGPGVEIVLLPDGPDAALSAALGTDPALSSLRQWGTAEPKGPPACFNRLVSRSDAAVVVLVESGTLLGPGCLTMLVHALAHPGRGLAGPSTNRSWNEQGVFDGAEASDVARTAALARQRFGAEVRSLEPLYSLANSAWPLDARSLRPSAGPTKIRHRALLGDGLPHPCRPCRLPGSLGARRLRLPSPAHGAAPRRRRLRDATFPSPLPGSAFATSASKGLRRDYEAHCRGESCEHFAPAALLTLRRPLDGSSPEAAGAAADDGRPAARPHAAARARGAAGAAYWSRAAAPAGRRRDAQATAPAGHRDHADPEPPGIRTPGSTLLPRPGLPEQGTGRGGGRHRLPGGTVSDDSGSATSLLG